MRELLQEKHYNENETLMYINDYVSNKCLYYFSFRKKNYPISKVFHLKKHVLLN